MNTESLQTLLSRVRDGQVEVDDAVRELRKLPFESLDYATLDHHRAVRCGFPEVIFGLNKTVDQVAGIFDRLAAAGGNVLATRATPEMFQAVARAHPEAVWHEVPRAITLKQDDQHPVGHVAVVAAGTSDLPVAEEAKITAEIMGQHVTTHYDVGVAGLHRLLGHLDELQKAKAVVVVAGMEGALGSVAGGLVGAPVIAVPTSVGYGANFGGVSALLAMLNSCASNVSVVNIDNGFSAGTIAAMISRAAATAPEGSA